MTTRPPALLVPVKDGRGAKTRLGPLSDDLRAELMAAFVRDALEAATRTPLAEVHLVGEPTALAPLAEELGVTVLPDEGEGDLNLALRRAAAHVTDSDRPVGVMLADLPCLTTADLDEALLAARSMASRCFVADAAGTGTTLLVAPAGTDLDPRFGPQSAKAHQESGATPLSADLRTLRLDVDTTADLRRALALGVGAHTAAVSAKLPGPRT